MSINGIFGGDRVAQITGNFKPITLTGGERMSLFIKDMTLYEFAGRLNADGIVLDAKNAFYTFYGHPIIDLPPHGRLIDADALIRKVPDVVSYDEDGEESNFGYTEDMILNEPTIIGEEEKK